MNIMYLIWNDEIIYQNKLILYFVLIIFYSWWIRWIEKCFSKYYETLRIVKLESSILLLILSGIKMIHIDI